MSAREDFGQPDSTDITREVGDLWFRHGLLVSGLRAFLSGLPRGIKVAALYALLIELRAQR